MNICHTCYREFDDNEMKRNASGQISNQCVMCYNMIGKGAGYNSVYNDSEIEEWLEGLKQRKEDLIEQGKI